MKKALKDIDPRQIVAARGLLRWSREDLADALEMTSEGVKKIENGVVQPRTSTLEKLIAVFEDRDVEFTESCGVRLRADIVRMIDGADCYIRLLDDVFHKLHDNRGAEALFICVDDAVSTPAVLAANKRLREAGIKCRYLCSQSAQKFDFDLHDYRAIPDHFYTNNVVIVYGDHLAIVATKSSVMTVNNASLARMMSGLFEMIWTNSKMPEVSHAKL